MSIESTIEVKAHILSDYVLFSAPSSKPMARVGSLTRDNLLKDPHALVHIFESVKSE